ncbi:hypothetical protein BS78_09G147900 [Paspalum vaginatum]|nr:hypothetical protein BS78_09G147900 [Paspalum vaginatum]KAJ1262958.1 hypothetical protein BS78_09G147900 [Paspalum vaginatum]
MGGGGRRGAWWVLPPARSRVLGKLGPSFGVGAGCGVGVGFGLIGGAGVGSGFHGLSLGFGFGAGCGIGIGFGYGFGKGVVYDENGRYSNIGTSTQKSKGPPSEYPDLAFPSGSSLIFGATLEVVHRLHCNSSS